MSVLKLEQFGGMLPAWDSHLVPNGQSDSCTNTYLFSGALTGWREPKLLRALNNSAATFAYRIPVFTQSVASAILAFVGNVNQGDTVKIGEEVYKFTATVLNPYDVLLGGTATLSATHLFQALTLTGTPGTTYGLGTVANLVISNTPFVNTQSTHNFGSGAIPVITLQAPTFGAAFNTTPVTESTAGVRLKWLYDMVSLSDTTTTFQGGTNQTFDSTITGAATWLEFVDPDTNVMKSPVVDDSFNRYYFASPSQPPQYNTYDRIVAGQPPFLLGVPTPGCAPGVTVTGGGDLAQLGNVVSTTTNVDTPGSNFMFLLPITPSGAMTLNDVSCMVETTSATAEFLAILYTDNNGPNELLNEGVATVGCTAGSPITSAFTNPSGLLLGVKYWIGLMCSEAIAILKADDTHTPGVKHTATFSNGAPLFAPSMTTNQPNWNMWADLTTDSLLGTRAYVYTWITAYGEESAPSPPTIVNGWSNGTWAIDLFTPPLDDMGVKRNIITTRLYRTVPATNGQTTYFFVADLPVLTASYNDTIDDSLVALNTILPSALWSPPPEGLLGIMSMPNGMAVGFKGNELWFCEPYRPHAWPVSYVLTTEFPIVGIGVAQQSVVACTNATPYTAAGVNPSSMALTKALSAQPCLSRGSIVSTANGVYYCSPNGLILVDQNGTVTNTSELWITLERWRSLTPQKNIRSGYLASSYFAFGTVAGTDHSVAQDGFTIELANDAASFTIWPQPGGHRIGFSELTAPNNNDIYNVMVDPWTGVGLLIQNQSIYYYDFSDQAPAIQPYTWRSKLFQQKYKQNYEAMKIYFSVPPGSPVQNATRKTDATLDPSWNTLDADRYGYVRVFADGNLVTTREIRSNGELLRILSGFKYETWQFEFTGRILISNVQIATSVKELANV